MEKDYYIGLDMGTGSVGFAVTDTNYEILKSHGKAQWGVRLFDTAKTAADRRFSRVNRRRLERRRQRILLLQEIFSNEIVKIDPGFFSRLNDSFFFPEDKSENQRNTLFNDPGYSDKNYHEQYPTIYHLRYDLMKNSQPHDIRLVYLALAHILKTRGHFLYSDTGNFKLGDQFKVVFNDFVNIVGEVLDIYIPEAVAERWHQILTDRATRNSEKQSLLVESIQNNEKVTKTLTRVLTGYEIKFKDLFGDQYNDVTPAKVKLSNIEDETLDQIKLALSEDHFALFEIASTFYNLVRLETLLQGADSLSQTKINTYEKHGDDLKKLKRIFKNHLTKDDYNRFFSQSEKGLYNYPAYSGHLTINKIKQPVLQKCDQEKFLDHLKKVMRLLPEKAQNSPEVAEVLTEIENGTFMPKITDRDNSLIPHQLHHAELLKILENASTYLTFLNEDGSDGYTKKQMIELLSDFRIPYYVGPLNPAHSIDRDAKSSSHHAWVSRLSDEPVRPWNFNRVIDVEQSASDFIANLTNKCTYLIGEDVLPKESPTYAKYSILNILNTVNIKGERLPVPLKQELFQHFFIDPKRKGKPTKRNITEFIQSKTGLSIAESDIGGMDLEIPGDMKAEKAIERIAPGKLTLAEKENIVRLVTVFPDSVKMLSTRIDRELGEKLTSAEISQLARLKFTGWGRLSAMLLNGIEAPNKKAEFKSIIDMMWEENLNLMEIMSDRFLFHSIVQRINDDLLGSNRSFSYQVVDNFPVSPPVKRMVWQALRIIKELIKVNHGQPPAKIFLEVAREEGEKVRTRSRKSQLLELYKDLRKQESDLVSNIESRSEAELRSKKLFLYFTQMGRCMYTGESISVESLDNKGADGHDIYDIDHIYPRSLTKDDSLLTNLVLVKSKANRDKGDKYPIVEATRKARIGLWAQLRESGLITEEKFRRLIRQSPLSDEELAGFINRQLVETRQAAKAAADLIRQFLPETQLVYVKAGHVSDFRYNQGEFKFPKVRGMNDLHHAKDAYLNIVVGNVFHSKFTQNPMNFIRGNEGRRYNLARMYDFPITSPSGEIAWLPGSNGSLIMVSKMMKRNNILVTYQTHHQHSGRNGGIFNQTILPKGQGQFPIKTADPRLNSQAGIDKYGAYTDETGATFFIVEHKAKKKTCKSIFSLGLGWLLTHPLNEETLLKYCERDLGLIEPHILVKNVPYNTILSMDGYPLRILAKTGSSIKMANVVQPVFSAEQEQTIKQVFVYLAKEGNDEDGEILENVTLQAEFLSLYDGFTRKLSEPPFSKLPPYARQVTNLENGREKFQLLTLKEQAKVLNQVLIFFLCDHQLSDISLISSLKNGRPQNTQVGMITISQNLPWEEKEIAIIYQSVTGIFEKRVVVSRA
jgi:CRISPR-associated endonuclease Csn1